MSEIKIPPRKGLQIVKKSVDKKENKMQCENTQNHQSAEQTNENLPSQGKTKIKIISFLGMTNTYKDVEDFQIKSKEDINTKGLKQPKQAQYILTSDFYKVFEVEKDTIKLDMWSATECLLKEFNNDNFDFTLYGTKLSNKKQSPIYGDKITPKEFDQKEYSKFLGDLINDLKNDFSSNKYKKIIIDITHGFRDNTILAIFAGLIQANINKDFKINFIVAKEIIQQQEYEFISLDEYVENMVMSNVLSTFKQCLKVPDYNLDNPLYLALKGFSDALFKNQIQDINKNLKNLFYYERNPLQSLLNLQPLINEIMLELQGLNKVNIKSAGNGKIKPKRAFYYELAVLYKKHDYFLNCVQFLLESIYLHIFNEFKQQLDRAKYEYCYSEYKAIRNFLLSFEETKPNVNQNNHRYTKYKNTFPDDIKLFNSVINLTKKIADLRNRMSHCDAFSDDYENNYKTRIEEFFNSYDEIFNNLNFSQELKDKLILDIKAKVK